MNNQPPISSGILKAYDKSDIPVTIEWQSDGMFAERTIAKMATLWECARQAYVPIEVDFLKVFPEVVGTESYYKPFEHVFEKHSSTIPWDQVAVIMEEVLKSHFVIDVSNIPPSVLEMYAHDRSIIVTIKDDYSDELLGFMSFMIRADYSAGDVKAIAAGVMPYAQNRGLGTLMMSSLFTIVPNIKRIFLSTRVTNTVALRAYESWGFVRDDNLAKDSQHVFNVRYWVAMNYDATQKDILQKVALTLTSE